MQMPDEHIALHLAPIAAQKVEKSVSDPKRLNSCLICLCWRLSKQIGGAS